MERSSPVAAAPPAIDPARTSLFLDFDGTLVDLAERPDAVAVNAQLTRLLERLAAKLEGRVAVVSGRSIEQLRGFLRELSGTVAMVGSHGAEVQTPGSRVVAPQIPEALGDAEQKFRDAFAGHDGVLIEVKTFGVAIHYRLAPQAEARAQQLASEFAARHGLELQNGKMMVEVRSAGHDKGSGIAALMAGPPFTGTVPVFLGDDLTDEPGFERCAEMGGFGVLVGKARGTAARYGLADVAAVHDWLGAL